MLIKTWIYLSDLLIGKLPPAKKRKAEELFLELFAILVEKSAEGAVRGMRND